MQRRLPPLNTLRAFEAAARHLSFTKAAEEIFVTQAAISHQIKTLEDALGVKLFKRLNRSLLLTEEGQTFLPPVREALETLQRGVSKLARVEATGALNVTTLASFSSGWLVPRLSRFRQKHPDIDIRLITTERLVDFNRDDIDVAVRFGQGGYANLVSERLIDEQIYPVCSPRLLQDPDKPLRTPEDLRHHTLLHDDMPIGWPEWLAAIGVSNIDTEQGPYFDLSALVIQAAVEGQGVALGRATLAAGALQAGLLVRPFELIMPIKSSYYVVCPEENYDRPKVKAFREWLFEEADKDGVRADAAEPDAAGVVSTGDSQNVRIW
ncbi:MAG: transcriptional regulator GcvA [Alphaproteobacteria bacterium]|nr:transcriptional regulator GcvA [Alphaproteobacteria bacterium]